MVFRLIKTVLDLFFPFFKRCENAWEGKLVEHEEENGEGHDFPENQRREKMRFKLWHCSHQKGEAEGLLSALNSTFGLLLFAKSHDDERND